MKPPTARDLAAAVPTVAWPAAAERLGMPNLDAAAFDAAAGRLRAAHEAVSSLQAELFALLAAAPMSATCAPLDSFSAALLDPAPARMSFSDQALCSLPNPSRRLHACTCRWRNEWQLAASFLTGRSDK